MAGRFLSLYMSTEIKDLLHAHLSLCQFQVLLHYQFCSCPPYGSLTQSVSSDHSHNDKFPVSPHAEPAMSQDSDIMDDSEPLSQTTLDFTNSLEEIAKLKAELKGAGHREDSLIPQIHTLSAAYRKRMQKLLMFRSN